MPWFSFHVTFFHEDRIEVEAENVEDALIVATEQAKMRIKEGWYGNPQQVRYGPITLISDEPLSDEEREVWDEVLEAAISAASLPTIRVKPFLRVSDLTERAVLFNLSDTPISLLGDEWEKLIALVKSGELEAFLRTHEVARNDDFVCLPPEGPK
jgi:hypothetical protein